MRPKIRRLPQPPELVKDSKGNVAIYESSPKAKDRINPANVGTGETSFPVGQAKYPFSMLLIGQSFVVVNKEDRKQQLRLTAYAASFGRRHNKKFLVLKHVDLNLFEVARIA